MKIKMFLLWVTMSIMGQNPLIWVDTITQVEATDICAFYNPQTKMLEDIIVVGNAFDTIYGNFQYVMSVNHFGYDVAGSNLVFYSQNSFWSLNGVYSTIKYFTIGESAFCLVEDSFTVLNGGVDTLAKILLAFSGLDVTGTLNLMIHRLWIYRESNRLVQSDNLFLLPIGNEISNYYSSRYGSSSFLTLRSVYISDIFQKERGRWLLLITWSGSLSVPSNSGVSVKGWSLVELYIDPLSGNPQIRVLYVSPVHDASQTHFGQPIVVGAPFISGGTRYGFGKQGPFKVWQAGDKIFVTGVFGDSFDSLFLDFPRTKVLPALPNGLGTITLILDTITYSLQGYYAATPLNSSDSVDIIPMGLLFDSTSIAYPIKLWYGWINRSRKTIDSVRVIRNGFVSMQPVGSQQGIQYVYFSLSGGTMEYGLPFSGSIRIEGLNDFASGEGVVGGVITDSANVPRWFQYKQLVTLDTVVWLGRIQVSGSSPYGYIIFSRGNPDFIGGGLKQVIPAGDGTVLALGMTARWNLKDSIDFWVYDLEKDSIGNVSVRDIYDSKEVRPYFDFLRYGGSWWIALLPCGTSHPVWEEVGLLYDTIGCNAYLMGPQYSFPPYDIRLFGHPPMDSMVLVAPGGCRYLHPGPYSIWLADTTVLHTAVSCNLVYATDPASVYYLYTPSGLIDSSYTGEFEILEAGSYWIVGIDSCDIKISDTISMDILASGERLRLAGTPSSQGGSYVLYGPSAVSKATVMDVSGHITPVKVEPLESASNCKGNKYMLEMPSLPPGIYILSIQGKKKQFTAKIVVQ